MQLSAANHSEEELKARRDSSQHAETTSKAAQGPEMDSLGCRAPFQSVSASHLEQTLAKPQGKENTQSNAGRRHALAKAVQVPVLRFSKAEELMIYQRIPQSLSRKSRGSIGLTYSEF